ncbi:MAG: methyltransferase domain-containing protein [Burkholderiales bacterium]
MPLTRYDIEREIARHPLWHYEFDLQGVRTPIRQREWVNRHAQRKRYFFDPLARAGAFRGKRVLDLGCNAGFWALNAVQAGCAEVVGIDARPMHVDQANLVFRAHDVPPERYRFVTGNVFAGDLEALGGPFDIVLCLGLLYHVCKPMELFERIRAVNRDLLVIDSTVLADPRNIIELRHEPLEDPRMSADYQLVFLPSPSAVHDMAMASGYSCATLAPRFDDWEGCDDFRGGDRYAFICARESDLAGVFTDVIAFSPRP